MSAEVTIGKDEEDDDEDDENNQLNADDGKRLGDSEKAKHLIEQGKIDIDLDADE